MRGEVRLAGIDAERRTGVKTRGGRGEARGAEDDADESASTFGGEYIFVFDKQDEIRPARIARDGDDGARRWCGGDGRGERTRQRLASRRRARRLVRRAVDDGQNERCGIYIAI